MKSGVELPPKVSELRRKLGQKAEQEPKFRFDTLYDRIDRPDVLTGLIPKSGDNEIVVG